jgi:hypothetical protein
MAKGNKPTITPAKPVIAPPDKLKNAPSTTGKESGKKRGNNPPKKG